MRPRSSAVRPILAAMGNPERIIHIGDSGAGQICKACNQLVIGGTLAAVGEAFALARKSEASIRRRCASALLGGFAASRVLEVHGERLMNEEFQAWVSGASLPEGSEDRDGHVERRANAAPVTAIVQQLLIGAPCGGQGRRSTTRRSATVRSTGALE